MRLYLSSYQVGNKPEELANLIGTNKRAAVIVNASDASNVAERGAELEEQMHNLFGLGFEPEEVDLRHFFDRAGELRNSIQKYGLVWVKGGNVFVLKRAFEQSGFDNVIRSLLETDSIVYGGYSAGACVMAPTLAGLDLCDDPMITPDGYRSDFSWNGMGILNYSILPHYESNHTESLLVDKIVK